MPDRTLGQPVTDELAIDGGTARIHEHGLALTGDGVTATAWWGLLGIGRPVMVSGDPAAAYVMILQVEATGPGVTLEAITTMLRSAITGRVVLTPTAAPGARVDLVVQPAENGPGSMIVVPVTAPAMVERVLYDVAVADGATVAPHAVYFRREWHTFGIGHVTDTHVARRIDLFRTLLTEAGRDKAARGMVSFNDRFRGFVRYANYLHDIGVLDLVVVTGDLYDYIHEVVHHDVHGNPTAPEPTVNPELLRDLILGRSDAPGFSDIEELRVPIFLIPGNHDYRVRPYHLVFDIKAPVIGTDADRVQHHDQYNLGQTEAAVLMNRLYPPSIPGSDLIPEIPVNDSHIQNLSTTRASDMVAKDDSLREYHRYLGDPSSHTVALGDHRIVLFDSGHDLGIVDSIGEWLVQRLGFAGEDEAKFLGGSPNCEGPSEGDVDEVARWLRDGPPSGLVIVAAHAPVVNIAGTEYPYFLRETQRRHQPDQVEAFLTQLTLITRRHEAMVKVHPTWFGPDGSREVDFVKRGNNDDQLDHGVSQGAARRLLHVLAGVDLPKPADLVLTGHTHRDNEFVVRRLPGGEPAMFHDYYTENPGSYYPSAFATSFGGLPEFERTWVTVQPGADPAGTPIPTPGLELPHEIAVPPYADPLNTSGDPRAWWDGHRPLILQTAALGPISGLREYAGFRVVDVVDDVIHHIWRVPIERLERSDWTLDWETARAPIGDNGTAETPWLSVSEGATSPGARVSAVPVGERIALFLLNPDGEVFTASGRVGRWSPWTSVKEGGTVPGGTVTAVVDTAGLVNLFLANRDGEVFTSRGSGTSWSNWVSVSQGSTMPGAPVSAVSSDDGLISLFLANPEGGVYTCRGLGEHWGGWSSVSEGSTLPGAPVTAIPDAHGGITLLLANPEGGVFTCRGFGESWGGWSSVREGASVPGGTIAATHAPDLTIGVFLTNPDGEAFGCRGFDTTWSNWSTVAQGTGVKGGAITAFPSTWVAPGQVAVVLADPSGGVYWSAGVDDHWAMWQHLPDKVTRPGAPVTAVRLPGSPTVTTLVMADHAGGVWAKRIAL